MVVTINGAELRYEVVGEGEPLLWLHGFMGSGSDWKYLLSEVPDGFRLIAPDLRGHGASTNPSGEFSFRQAADDVLALLRHLSVGTAKAIGVSGGGIALLHMATAVPSCLESMVIVSAPPYFPEQARAIQRQASLATVSELELNQMRARHRRGDEQLQHLFAQARAFANSYDDVNFTPPYLSTITADTLIVFGDRDPLYPVSLAFELHAAIPRSHLWIVPNGGHSPVFGTNAITFATTAVEFLQGAWSTEKASRL
jgi:pimeloyl-ACP methyl ester carboxylesterase